MGGWPRLGPLQGRPTTTKAPAHGVSSCRVVPTRGGPNSQDCRQQGQQHWPQGRRRSEGWGPNIIPNFARPKEIGRPLS
ncbi:hypothetical protein GW17_00006882 [Ensete ventricosum]|nr:hypothetical protein GW17_00006882 [Ensete ventricosum]